jgi:translation initiation factor IF-3
MLGVVSLEKALSLASLKGKDLVEVSPKANPPVCKVMNFGQFLYQQKKADQKNKKKQKKTEVKGIRLGFRIGEHDLQVKEKQARKFLENGDLIKVSMIFKGREITYLDLGEEKIKDFLVRLEDISEIEQPLKKSGHQLTIILKKK